MIIKTFKFSALRRMGLLLLLFFLLALSAACGGGGAASSSTAAFTHTGSFTGAKVTCGDGVFTLTLQNGSLSCEELAGTPQDTDALESFAAGCEAIGGQVVDGAKITDEEYGLVTPAAHAELEYTEGVVLTLSIGNAAPGGGYYFSVQGQNIVYLGSAPVFAQFLLGPGQFAKSAVTAFNFAPGTAHHPAKITFTIKGETVVLEHLATPATDGYGNIYNYCLPSHGGAYVSDEAYNAYFAECTAMLAAGKTGEPPQGFDPQDPFCTITIENGTEKQTLFIGAPSPAGTSYVAKAGDTAVYIVEEKYLAFLNATAGSLATPFILAPAMETVTNITVITPGSGAFYVIDIYDGSGIVDGAPLAQPTFAGLYRLLCSLQAQAAVAGEVENTNEGSVSLAFHFTDGTATTAKLVPVDGGFYAIFINDVFTGSAVREAFCEKLLFTLEQITNGQIIDPTW